MADRKRCSGYEIFHLEFYPNNYRPLRPKEREEGEDEMTALERIKSMQNGVFRHQDERVDFLLKAFDAAWKVAIKADEIGIITVEEEFEKMMKDVL